MKNNQFLLYFQMKDRHDSGSSKINLSNIDNFINSLFKSKNGRILNLAMVFTSDTVNDLKATYLPMEGRYALDVVSPLLFFKKDEKLFNFIFLECTKIIKCI